MEKIAARAPRLQRYLHRGRRDREIIEAQRRLECLELPGHESCRLAGLLAPAGDPDAKQKRGEE